MADQSEAFFSSNDVEPKERAVMWDIVRFHGGQVHLLENALDGIDGLIDSQSPTPTAA